ncbi:trypsin-like serine peptidase [Ruegeria lacuscaerulensis]|uniref:trypsin-like serine peptidase n=1 Tax=Ruegeria lacuscaerulensis TaxID=55218 RepID=UPI00147E398A|nr:serine protease [Ruegeria lacuscaerulensis]
MAVTLNDIGLPVTEGSIARTHARLEKIRQAEQLIAKRMGHEAESELRRLRARLREDDLAAHESHEEPRLIVARELGQEAYIGPRTNILSGEFLEIGLLTSRAVCKITDGGVETGTGFLVGDGIVLTNHHVISDIPDLDDVFFEFLFDDNTIGTPVNPEYYVADPDRFFVTDETLDVTFVALQENGIQLLSSLGWLPLLGREGKILIGDPVNIIQHPEGEQKRVVVHDSTFLLVENNTDADAFCWYSGDTQKGSSGSPVLNSRWEVVALHHAAVPATDKNGNVLDVNGKTISLDRLGDADTRIKWIANEGVRVSRMVRHIEEASLTAAHDAVRQSLLKLWDTPLATRTARLAALHGMT